MRIFFRTLEEIEAFLNQLPSLICPFCGAVGVVIRHGTIRWSHSPEQYGMKAFIYAQCDVVGLGHNAFSDEAVALIVRSSEGILRRTRNLCISAMLEAVRDRKQVVGIDQVNRVLMQPHWRKDHDLDPL
jgi:hypothetical protein